jgi:hypothetical protein
MDPSTTGGSVGIGAMVGIGVRVGQGVKVGFGATVAGVWIELSVIALAASRRATRSQMMTKLIRLKAISVARNPLPSLASRLRTREYLVVILVLLVVFVLAVIVIFTIFVLTTVAAATAAACVRSLAHCNFVIRIL